MQEQLIGAVLTFGAEGTGSHASAPKVRRSQECRATGTSRAGAGGGTGEMS
jgi:hypothetical protein